MYGITGFGLSAHRCLGPSLASRSIELQLYLELAVALMYCSGRYTDAKIVDARNGHNPEKKLNIHWLLSTHILRAEPLNSIYNPLYFYTEIQRLEEAYDRRLAAVAKLKVCSNTVQ